MLCNLTRLTTCQQFRSTRPSLHPYLECEDGGEEGVADLEGEGDDARLVVVLDAHRDHVQEDQHEDGDLKPAEEAMTLECGTRSMFYKGQAIRDSQVRD